MDKMSMYVDWRYVDWRHYVAADTLWLLITRPHPRSLDDIVKSAQKTKKSAREQYEEKAGKGGGKGGKGDKGGKAEKPKGGRPAPYEKPKDNKPKEKKEERPEAQPSCIVYVGNLKFDLTAEALGVWSSLEYSLDFHR
jgi:hypothetical protein